MKEKITYILGAGASVGTFPLVKPIKDGSLVLRKSLADKLIEEGEKMDVEEYYPDETIVTKNKIMEAMIATGENANEFGNVDSYAKYLYHTGGDNNDQLRMLKIALTYFFVRQQICSEYERERKERRYLNFITSLINDESAFPNHVKILNWNYDFLFQLAAMNYKPEKIIKMEDYQNIAFSTFTKYYPGLNANEDGTNDYSLIHLNGIAGISTNPGDKNVYRFHNIIGELVKGKPNKKISEIDLMLAFHRVYMNMEHLITFAWEKKSSHSLHFPKTLDLAQQLAAGTTILVVIGYSFPFYNRELDNTIIETMKPTLRKIYFQDPYGDGEFLRKRYDLNSFGKAHEARAGFGNNPTKSFRDFDIESIKSTDEFFIPREV